MSAQRFGVDTAPSRHELMSVAIARSQEVCVAYVNAPDRLGEAIETLFNALSRIQEHDDALVSEGPTQ